MRVVAWLVVLFVVAPVVELFVIVRVASEVGVIETIALLFVVSLLGAALVKRQGLAVARRLRDASASGADPSRALVDGFLVLVAGVLLLSPGFVTDILGLALLLPPVRALVAPIVLRRVAAGGRTRVVRITGTRPISDPIDVSATVEDPSHRRPGASPLGPLPPGRP